MSEEAVQEDYAPETEVSEESVGEEVEASTDGEFEGEEGGESVQAESVEELQDELEEAAEAGASTEELQNMVREFELKVNGKTLTRKLDLSDDEAIKRELQKAYAGQQAMQQKAELETALKGKVNEWKADPKRFFADMQMDVDEFAEMRMAQKLEEMKKDPKELEREQRELELEQLRNQLKAKEEAEELRDYEKMQEEAAMYLDNEISDALDAHSTLNASPRVVKQIADTLAWAITPENEGGAGFDPDDISVKDILPTVEKELKKEISDLLDVLPDEVLEQWIGNKNIDRIKKKAIAKAKNAPKSAKSINKPSAPKPQPREETKKKRSFDDFLSVRNR